ncbi:MAG: O-antigen ligase family protein [bacterium]|nr:O-antigen ligase family protein [bacterium]
MFTGNNIQAIKAANGRQLMKLFLLAILALFLPVVFNFTSYYIISAILFIFFGCIFFRAKLYLLLILSIPALAYGQFIYFPVTVNWIYEASLTEVIIILVFSIFLIDKFINGELKKIRTNSLLYLLLAYLIISLISFINIVDFRLYVAGLKTIVFSCLAYWLSINLLDNKQKINLFIYSLTATVLILSGQIFIKFYQIGWSSKFFFERSSITITLGAIATTAAILALILPIILSLYFYLDQNNKIKPLVFIGFAIGALAMFLTLGKAAIFSLSLGLGYLFIKLKNKRIIFTLAALVFVVGCFIFFTSFFSGLLERLSYAFIDANSKFRILEYQTGWKIIKDNPWFGVGAGQQLYYFKKLLNFNTAQLVNNFFLQAWIDFGIIGLALAVLMFGNIYRRIVSLAKSLKPTELTLGFGFIAALIVSLVNGLAEVTFFALPYAIVFWSITGIFYNLEKDSPR